MRYASGILSKGGESMTVTSTSNAISVTDTTLTWTLNLESALDNDMPECECVCRRWFRIEKILKIYCSKNVWLP